MLFGCFNLVLIDIPTYFFSISVSIISRLKMVRGICLCRWSSSLIERSNPVLRICQVHLFRFVEKNSVEIMSNMNEGLCFFNRICLWKKKMRNENNKYLLRLINIYRKSFLQTLNLIETIRNLSHQIITSFFFHLSNIKQISKTNSFSLQRNL